MKKYETLLEEAVYSAPLALLSIKDEPSLDLIKNLLPYSTGFEIECHGGKQFNHNDFKAIPYIMDSPGAYVTGEYRFRIPYGFNGLMCLYFISEQCKRNLELNPGSGIHYHVDMTDCWDEVNKIGLENVLSLVKKNIGEDILCELDTWNYAGHYGRNIGIGKGYWMGFRQEHRTMEFRTGNMTFEYSEIVKCIISANKAIRWVKNLLLGKDVVTQMIADKKQEIDYNAWLVAIQESTTYGKVKKRIEALRKKIEESKKAKIALINPEGFNDLTEINKIINSRTNYD